MVIKLVLCIHLMFLADCLNFSELMNSLKRIKINIGLLYIFSSLNAFPLLLSFYTSDFRALSMKSPTFSVRSFAHKQPVLSPTQFSDVWCCQDVLGQQETLTMYISDLEKPQCVWDVKMASSLVCLRLSHLYRPFDGFSRISAKRGRDISWREKVLDQVYI